MKKLAQKVFITAAAVGIGAIVLNQYLQSSMQKELDKNIRKAEPFAHIQYNSFELTLPDRIQLTDLRIIPKSPNIGNFNIDSIDLTIADSDTLLLAKQLLGLSSGVTPDKVEVDIKGLSLSLTEFPQYTSALIQLNQHLDRQMTPFCGDSHFIGPDQLKDLGFEPLRLDLNFAYDFNPWEETLDVGFEAEMDKGSSTRTRLKLLNIPALNQSTAMAMMKPSVDAFSIHYEDNGYTAKVNQYCADQSELSLEDFIERETSRPDQDYALMWGFVPGFQLKQAYKNFMQDPQRVSLQVQPSPDFDWFSLSAYPPEQWPETINLSLSVNDEPVTSLDFELADLDQFVQASKAEANKPPSIFETGVPPKPVAEPEAAPLVFVPIDKRRIREYEGRIMRIYNPSGKAREGEFIGMEGNSARLRQEKFGGSFIMSITLFDVERIEVAKETSK